MSQNRFLDELIFSSPFHTLDSDRSLCRCWRPLASSSWRAHEIPTDDARVLDRWRSDTDTFGNSTAADCKSSLDESASKTKRWNEPTFREGSRSSDSNLNFVNPLHVVAKLVEVLDVAIADFADNKLRLSAAGIRTLTRFDAGLLLLARQGCDRNAWCRWGFWFWWAGIG